MDSMDLPCVSDCSHLEQAVNERLATFSAFFQNAPVAMVLLDEDRQICEMNRAAEEIFSVSAAKLKGLRFGNAVRCVNSLEAPGSCGLGLNCGKCSTRRSVADTFETGQMLRQVEVKLVLRNQPDSRDKHLLLSAALSELSDGRQVLVCIEDITQRKRAELHLQEALSEIQRLQERLQRENAYLREEIKSSHDFEEIVGQSEEIKLAISKIKHVADTDANVLLLGETGTGKELFARAIHHSSRRGDSSPEDCPLVKVNCAALPASLIESELFGHVEGAFTGATSDKVGRFQLADGGTIFLDEIGELDPELQAKLLQVLQDGEFESVGSTKTIKVDVRVIAATNRDLRAAMKRGSFRPDLYYRLAVFPIEVPPLRLRRDDIPLLVWHFIEKKQHGLGKTISRISPNAMNALVEYDWPGNVRELENVVERAMILSPGPTLALEGAFAKPAHGRLPDDLSCNLEDVDRAHIAGVLENCDWRIKGANGAADRLGLKPSTLRYRLKKLGIQRPPRRPR